MAVKNTDGSWKELLFMDTPSTATAKKVLRINENGIGFSDKGIGGPYAQAWTLDGTLSLGGLNNAYGNLIILSEQAKKVCAMDKGGFACYDANGRIIAEFSEDGCWFDAYNSSGSRIASSYVYGDGIMISESGSNNVVTLDSNGLNVTGERGTSTDITYNEVSTQNLAYRTLNGRTCYNGTFTFDDGTVFTILRGVITGIQPGSGSSDIDELWTAIADLQEQIDDISGGGSGVTANITIDPTRSVDLEFDDGLLTDWDSSPY